MSPHDKLGNYSMQGNKPGKSLQQAHGPASAASQIHRP